MLASTARHTASQQSLETVDLTDDTPHQQTKIKNKKRRSTSKKRQSKKSILGQRGSVAVQSQQSLGLTNNL
mgnify:CR=1 FL=1